METEFVLEGEEESSTDERIVRFQQGRDWIEAFQSELDVYYSQMQTLNSMDSMEVFQKLSSFSARFSEIRTQLVRVDTRKSTAFRTREVDPFLAECDRQFRIHSRLQSVKETDWKMAGGQF